MRRFLTILLFFSAAAPAATATAFCCPFCEGSNTPTFIEDFKDADLILFGRLENPQLKDFTDGVTDLVIEEVVKAHPFLKERKRVQIPRYVKATDLKFLVFCRVYKD